MHVANLKAAQPFDFW